MTLLHTSPLLFLRPAGQSTLAGKPLSSTLSLTEIEMLSFFAEPHELEQAKDAGFQLEMVDQALSRGLLVECNESGFGAGSTWEDYNLQRAAFYMFSSFQPQCPSVPAFREPLKLSGVGFADSLPKLLNRRTERFFKDEPLPIALLTEVVGDVNDAIRDTVWLSSRVLVQGVEGLTPGVYDVDKVSGAFTKCNDFVRKDLLECLHGQWWLNGSGVCFFFVVSLAEPAKLDELVPRNYFEVILLLGAAGQALLNSAYSRGLGCWMTPALSESLAARILNLNDHEEALYFFKVGIPDRGDAGGEKRSPI